MNKITELQKIGDRMYQELWWTYYVRTGIVVPDIYFMKGKFLMENPDNGFISDREQFTGYVPPDEWLHLPELDWLMVEILRIANHISMKYHKVIATGMMEIYVKAGAWNPKKTII